jgi:ubiquinone/menaquinone biosynthesis C-methylase UbiE
MQRSAGQADSGIDTITNKSYLATNQYNGTVHFKHRTKIFDYGSTVNLRQWAATQYSDAYSLNNCAAVLEVGCGDGAFWEYMAPAVTVQLDATLTDLSSKMLEECKANLNSAYPKLTFNYTVADIDALDFKSEQFDAVLAHNVIYHAEIPERAIEGMKRVLKPTGFMGLSVLNHDVNKAIWAVANKIDGSVPTESFTSRFSDTHADKILPRFFSSVEKRDYKNTLRFTESEPVVSMVKSTPTVQKLNLQSTFFQALQDKVDREIEEHGAFVSEFNASLYLCKK